MEQDVKKFCATCGQCHKMKGAKTKQYELGSTSGSYPFQRIVIDYWGPLPATGCYPI